jgi:hypothetical protein
MTGDPANRLETVGTNEAAPVRATERLGRSVEDPEGVDVMRAPSNHGRKLPIVAAGLLVATVLAAPHPAFAGKLSWLDDVVQEVVVEAKASGKAAARGGDGASAKVVGRLFAHEADEGLETLARRYDDLARLGRRIEEPSEALLEARFQRLIRPEPEMARTFKALKPAEKRLVVEMGETAQRLARRYPGQAETMIRRLGTEGLSAVRLYGDDVAEVLVKEGPETVGILRKTGQGGWKFFTGTVLPHKKKLIAAGVFAAFLANPDKFVDFAGRATEYAVREFSRAGIQLAGSVSGGAARGLESALAGTLGRYGVSAGVARYVGMGLAGLVVLGALAVLLGLPLAWMLRPFRWIFGLVRGTRPARVA